MAFKNTYYIVAGSLLDYHNWINSDRPRYIIPEMNAGEHYQIRYVSSVDILRGLSEIKGFYLKGCERHPEFNRIKSVIEVIKITSKIKTIPANNNTLMGKTITGVWLDEYEDSSGGTVDQGAATP